MYCEPSDIEAIFGSNVREWADIDHSSSRTAIDARIQHAIQVASSEIDSLMANGWYKLPLMTASGAVPDLVREICATLAGIWLYELRGVEEIDPQTGRPVHRLAFKRLWAEKLLEELRTGQRRIDGLVKA